MNPLHLIDIVGSIFVIACMLAIGAVFVAACVWGVLALTPSIVENFKIAKAAIKDLEEKP